MLDFKRLKWCFLTYFLSFCWFLLDLIIFSLSSPSKPKSKTIIFLFINTLERVYLTLSSGHDVMKDQFLIGVKYTISLNRHIGLVGRAFANGPGDLGSVPGHTKCLYKWYLIPPCLTLSKISFVSRVKWSNPGKGVTSSLTPWCSSYWKGNLLFALDYGRQLYFIYLLYYQSGLECVWK